MAFLIDDILLAPMKGVHFISKKIHEAAEKELLDEEGVRRELRDLYTLLETHKISEREFEEREACLIERLEEIQEYKESKKSNRKQKV